MLPTCKGSLEITRVSASLTLESVMVQVVEKKVALGHINLKLSDCALR